MPTQFTDPNEWLMELCMEFELISVLTCSYSNRNVLWLFGFILCILYHDIVLHTVRFTYF